MKTQHSKILVLLIFATLTAYWQIAQAGVCNDLLGRLHSLNKNPHRDDLAQYEAIRVLRLKQEEPIEFSRPAEGFTVTERDNNGRAMRAKFRVLSDNPDNKISFLYIENGQTIIGPELTQDKDEPAFFQTEVEVMHGMEYALLLNNRQVIDPAAETSSPRPKPLNSRWWDHDDPHGYQMKAPNPDLRGQPLNICEAEVGSMAQEYEFEKGKKGCRPEYAFRSIADSAIPKMLWDMGYNVLQLEPINESVDSSPAFALGRWENFYRGFGHFGPTSRYGTPDDFKRMVDAFHFAGIEVIIDYVPSHWAYEGDSGERSLKERGMQHWKKPNGEGLYGHDDSGYKTMSSDMPNAYVAAHFEDGLGNIFKHYKIGGIRLDNPYGTTAAFLKGLSQKIRSHFPQAILITEDFSHSNESIIALNNGMGYNFRYHPQGFDTVKDNLQRFDEHIDMGAIGSSIRDIYNWGGLARLFYVTNHDEAANWRGGATGAYFPDLLKGAPWWMVEGKAKVWSALATMSGGARLDMLQFRTLQAGSLNSKPAVEWSRFNDENQRMINNYFSHLYRTTRDNMAFSFVSMHPQVENHIDPRNPVISLLRINYATEKKYPALVNLGTRGIDNYQFGVQGAGNYHIIIDSDRTEYHGTGELARRLPSGELSTNNWGDHGKSHSITVPYIAPLSAVVFEQQ